jgi:plastocyanin
MKEERMRLVACLLAIGGALLIAGCGGSGKSTSSSGSSSSGSSSNAGSSDGGGSGGGSSSSASGGGGESVPVEADPGGALKFTTTKLEAKAGTVTFKFKNPAAIPHGFSVEGHGVDKGSKVVTNGSTSLTVKLKPGKYEFFCPVTGHRAAGMEGTLTVS